MIVNYFIHLEPICFKIFCDITKEWGDEENGMPLSAIHKVGMVLNKAFKIPYICISQMFLYRFNDTYNKTSSKCVRKRFSPLRSIRKRIRK